MKEEPPFPKGIMAAAIAVIVLALAAAVSVVVFVIWMGVSLVNWVTAK